MLLSNDGDVMARTKDGVTALSFIVRHTPEVLSELVTRLDEAVSLLYHGLGDVDCVLRVDFQPLVPLGSRNETDLMLCLVEVDQGHILKHPLCESFLHLKWKRIRKFFVIGLLFHLIFVALFTGFVCATYLWHDEQLSRVLFWPVLTITWLFASKEIIQITYGIYYYIKRWENWLQWSMIVVSFIILIPPGRQWQHHVAALGILLAWIELMIVIGYFPIFGLYIQIFTRASMNFFKFLAPFLCLIIGFSLSFYVLHGNYKSFADPLLSLLKVVIMMSGELEFENAFFDKEAPLEYPGTAHFILLCFVILVTLVLTNLIVTLAVSDIQELRKRAHLDRLVRHAEVIARFENMLFSKLLDYISACNIIQVCRKNILLLYPHHCALLCIRPNDPREKRLPRKLIQLLYRLAGGQKMRHIIAQPESELYKKNTVNTVNTVNKCPFPIHATPSWMYSNDRNQQQSNKKPRVQMAMEYSHDTELKICSHDVAELDKYSRDFCSKWISLMDVRCCPRDGILPDDRFDDAFSTLLTLPYILYRRKFKLL